ncbi:MAG: DUF6580 family putative transport protein [Patescibacteria group bacterium]
MRLTSRSNGMRRETIIEIGGLIALGVMSRLLPHLPNMTAMSAIALKARTRFGPLGLAVPLVSMLLSDAVIGFYNWKLLLSVYASFAIVGMLGVFLKRSQSVVAIAMVATVGSIIFFLVTNAAVWALSSWYPHTPAGLLACYAAGLLFLFPMLCGDMLFSFVLFRSGHAFSSARASIDAWKLTGGHVPTPSHSSNAIRSASSRPPGTTISPT